MMNMANVHIKESLFALNWIVCSHGIVVGGENGVHELDTV
jgi:hypothetical protein